MIYDFDHVPERRGTGNLKWDDIEPGVLPMWVADMDFVSPRPVVEALHRKVEHGLFGYPTGGHGEPKELGSFRALLIERLKVRYGWEVNAEELCFVPGVVTAFNKVCHAVATAGGGVLVQPPVYPPILDAAPNAGLVRQEALLEQASDGSYHINWDSFASAFTPETRLFLLCNPHNPVGRVFTRDELERMAQICLERHVPICSDEIHCDLVFSGHRHVPIASISPDIAQNTITLMAPSKTYNLAGLQCSFAVIPNPELRRQFQAAGKGLVSWVNMMGLAAGEAAYRDGQEWLDQLLPYLGSNRNYVTEFVRRELDGITVAAPQGTYLAWLDCREAGLGDSICEFFLKNAKVAMNDGAAFGTGGKGFVRLNFGCPRSMLEDALGRMRSALESV
jgi:cystathionine beta-lyase